MRQFSLVDVFGSDPFTGNPVAVIACAEDLSPHEMQQITRWLNLSESAFLLPPSREEADYRVRIFTLARELPFAGHPTLGSCHVWLQSGGQPRRQNLIIQECSAGLVEISRSEESLAFAAPGLLRTGRPSDTDLDRALDVLRIDRAAIVDAQWADNGPGWLVVMLNSAEAVLAIEPARYHPERVDVGVVGPYPSGSGAAVEVRAFFSGAGGEIIEDPVTGSLNASVGQLLFETGRASNSYVARQGTRLGRSGRVNVTRDKHGQVWVGGRTQTMYSGQSTDVRYVPA